MKKRPSLKAQASQFRLPHEIGWKDFQPGFVLTEIATSRYYQTGDWRSLRPVWDNSRCIRCGVCWIYCPDMAVVRRADGYFEADYTYCKGCGICARECVTQCIEMKEEK